MSPQPAAHRRQLRGNLWRIGWWSSPVRGVNALGSALALLAFVAVWLGLVSGTVAGALYAHRAEVSRARTPVPAAAGEAPALLWASMNAGVDERIVGVIALEPRAAAPPLPPGVARWPQPGEAVLSPALRDLLVARGVPDRYGRPAGLIGRDGLAAATELLAYVRLPAPVDEDSAFRLTGFGVGASSAFHPVGEVLYDRSVTEFWALSLFLLVVPGAIALAAAARVADAETRRRHLLLVRLGASRGARAMVALPRVLPVAALSLVLAVVLLLTAASADVTVPLKGNVIDAAVVRGALPALLAVVVVAHTAAAGALALLTASRQGKAGASRLVAPPDRPARVRTGALLAVLAVQPVVIALADDPTILSVSTMAAAAVTVACLPAAVATGLHAASAWRARRNLATGRVGAFLGWQITGYRSRALARLTAVVGALVVVVGHAATVLAMFTGPALDARLVAQQVGTSLMVAETQQGEVGDTVRFARDHGLAAVTVTRTDIVGDDGAILREDVTLTGDCPDLQVLGVACRDGALVRDGPSARLDALTGWYARSGPVAVAVGPPGTRGEPHPHAGPGDHDVAEWRELVFLSRDGGDLDGLALARDAHLGGLVLHLEQLGAGAVRGAVDLLHKSYWLFVFGVPGVLVLLLVGALTWAAVVIDESVALVRSPLLAERRDVFGAVAAVRIALPVAAGGLAGAGATAWLLMPHVRAGAAQFPAAFLAGAAITTLAVAALAWRLARQLMIASSRQRWGT